MTLAQDRKILRAIEQEMDAVKKHSTPEIQELELKLRLAKEKWAREHIVPVLNSLEQQRASVLKSIKSRKLYLTTRKNSKFSPKVLEWFKWYKPQVKGTSTLRWVNEAETYVIVTNRMVHRNPSTITYALRLSQPIMCLDSVFGRMTKGRLQEMINRLASNYNVYPMKLMK